MSDRTKGIIDKFFVERLTPSSRGIDHSDCHYFVLDPQHDPHARSALSAYEKSARADGFLPLADDLRQWLHSIEENERRAVMTRPLTFQDAIDTLQASQTVCQHAECQPYNQGIVTAMETLIRLRDRREAIRRQE